jgi:hypothetical protein
VQSVSQQGSVYDPHILTIDFDSISHNFAAFPFHPIPILVPALHTHTCRHEPR